MTRSKKRAIAGLMIVLGLAAFVVPCAGSATAYSQPAVVMGWERDLHKADAMIKRGAYAGARRIADRVLAEMREQIESGDSVPGLLALAALVRGLAEAGLGHTADAQWDWDEARTLYPPMAKSDLSPYGAFARILQEGDPTQWVPGPIRMTTNGDIKKPVATRRKNPEYPRAQRVACREGTTIVELVINREGRPVHPVLLNSPGGPTLGLATMEALREWRFHPATLGGQPINVYFVLTVNFSLLGCRH